MGGASAMIQVGESSVGASKPESESSPKRLQDERRLGSAQERRAHARRCLAPAHGPAGELDASSLDEDRGAAEDDLDVCWVCQQAVADRALDDDGVVVR